MNRLIRPGKIEHYRVLHTENPEKELWKRFLLLADVGYLKKIWEFSEPSGYAAVSTYIKQAHEYYIASKSVSHLTKSVQIYYCFLNLSKAVLYIMNKNAPPEYHGLCNPLVPEDFLNTSATVNNGIFPQVVNLFGSEVERNSSVKMDFMLRNIIEMHSSYTEYFDEHNGIFTPRVTAYVNAEIEISFHKKQFINKGKLLTLDDIQRHSNLLDDFSVVENGEDAVILKSNERFRENAFEAEAYDLIKRHFQFSVYPDDRYYIQMVPESERIPCGSAYFAVMYLLSCISRYSAKRIMEFTDSGEESLLWFVNDLCDTAARVYPNYLLNKLLEGVYKFAHTN